MENAGRRRSARIPLAMDAQCRIAGGQMEVSVADLSARGCRVVLVRRMLRVEQKVVLRPRGLEGLAGTVRWLTEDAAGIEFDSPLHPSIVEFLCNRHPRGDETITLDLAA